MYPIIMIIFNSLKVETAISTNTVFELPRSDTFNGLNNFISAITRQGFLQSFFYSAFITVTSLVAILVCCSMCAYFITRIRSKVSSLLYYLFVFSMVVPFQMVMFTLSQTADMLNLNTPYNIFIIYLGFGAGLAVFMFAGFMKSVPVEVEEAAIIDGCNPLQTFFLIVFPILKPTIVSVGILEAMWLWNDYLLPTLVLDIKKYRTIPMLIQYFRGSYGKVEMGPMMASIVLTVLPIIVIYVFAQKYIIKGMTSGAVKG
ncbi:MAG: carbohydrate ABC transporter permease [Lachnospiraceae bacterium]|nr:carbohydrate ABC transporter permease [Lachnospiraceae bacterium]